MTATSVKDVGSMLNPGVRSAGSPSKTEGEGFSAVWSGQAEANKAPEQNQTAKESGTAADKAKPGEELRAKDRSRKNIREDDPDNVQEARGGESATEVPGEELGNIMEALATAAAGLMEQIRDTFEISGEALQEVMTDMGLEPVELLQPENLSSLLLQLGGAEDTLSLLTDEQLCSDYRMLMEQAKTALGTVSEAAGISPGQLLQTVEENVGVPDETPEGPVIEVTKEGSVFPVQTTGDPAAVDGQQMQGAQESADGRNEKESGHGNGRHAEADGNLMLQGIRSESFRPQTESVQEPGSIRDADTQDMMRQIMDYMRVQVKSDVSSLEMQLHPASLGTLQIHVAAKGGVLTANFITQNEAVKAALESQMVQLKESFAQQGVRVEAIEVTVQTHQFEQNLEQGREGQTREEFEGKRPRTRRIRLGGEDGTEIFGEPGSEERMAAEMMAANGGTVDFTA